MAKLMFAKKTLQTLIPVLIGTSGNAASLSSSRFHSSRKPYTACSVDQGKVASKKLSASKSPFDGFSTQASALPKNQNATMVLEEGLSIVDRLRQKGLDKASGINRVNELEDIFGDTAWVKDFAADCGFGSGSQTCTGFCTSGCGGGDSTPPSFENSTPSQNSVSETQVVIDVDINEGGTAYAVAVADGDGTPSAAQVKAGQNSGGSAAIASSSVTLNSGAYSGTITLTGLSAGTAYDVYVVAQDDEGTPNVQAAATRVDITTTASPEMNIQGNGQNISDGDATPTSSDDTDFGSHMVGGSNLVRTFTIQNTGAGSLDLTGSPNVAISGSSDFSVTSQPGSDPVSAAGSTTFQVTLDPTTVGTQTASISIANDDADENPYNFDISATVVNSATTTAAAFNTTNGTNLTPAVTFGAGDETLTLGAASHTTGSTADGSTGTDTLVTVTGADLSALTSLSGFETITIPASATVTMTSAQHNAFTTFTDNASQTISLTSGSDDVSGNANIENYSFGSSYSGVFTLGAAGQGVVGADSAVDVVDVGTLTATGLLLGGSGTDELRLSTGANIAGATVSGFETLTVASGASVTMSEAQHDSFTTISGSGTEQITISDSNDGFSGDADIETYVLGAANTITLGAASQNVTGSTGNDVIDIGTLTATGTLNASTGTDTLQMSNGASTAGATVSSFENLTLGSGATVSLTAAQLAQFAGTVTAAGTETINVSGDGDFSTLSNIESFSVGDDSTNTRTITIAAAGTSVSASSATDAITFDVGTLTYTGTITGEGTVDDTISLSTGANISGATISNIEVISLASGASVTMTEAQHDLFDSFSATGTQQITIASTTDGFTGNSAVETYALGTANSITLGSASQNVTGSSGDDTINVGALTATGTLNASSGTDTLQMSNGASIAGATVSSFENLTLADNASVTIDASQLSQFSGTITAGGAETITVSGDGDFSTFANIEGFLVNDDSTNTRTITIGNASAAVTASSATDAITFDAGALTLTGTLIGDGTTNDTLSLDDTASITGATITGIENLTLANNATVDILASQISGFTGTITAAGSETVNISGDGDFTTLSSIETYSVGDDSTDTRTITLSSANQSVTANAASDAVTFDIGTLTLTGTLTGEGTAADTLTVSNGASISGATLNNISNLTLSGGATLTLTPTQLNAFSGTITAAGTDTLVLSATGTLSGTNLAAIETIATLSGGTEAITIPASVAAGKTLTATDSGTDSFIITGETGTQTITGSAGGDTMDGGDGDDTIEPGAGTDSMTGGNGADTFSGSVSDLNGDTITDLESGDSIKLTGVTGLSTANVRFNGTSFEIDTNATSFASPEVSLDTVSNLSSSLTILSVSDSGSDTIITFGVLVSITSATYDASTGGLVVTGVGFAANAGSDNDVDVSALTFTGEGGATYSLTTSDVEIDSSTQFSVSLNATDQAAINQIFNKDGTTSTGGTTYNIASADDFIPAITDGNTADATNAVTVSNVAAPTITSATYDASSGVLAVTGTGLLTLNGATNDIDVSLLTVTGDGSASYTLTSDDVDISSGTGFSVTLNSADKLAVNGLLNKDGTSSGDATTYNLAAAEDWNIGADASVNIADTTSNGITVSNVGTPTITSATYDASTGALVVTGTNFVNESGGTNDVDVSALSLTGEGGNSYTLTTSDVEVTSATEFSINLSSADQLNVNGLLNKNGTTSDDVTTYNLAAADNWMPGADENVDIADATGNGVTVSNVAAPTLTSAVYNAGTGALVITGTNFVKYPGSANDLDVTAISLTGDGNNSYTLTSTDVEINSATSASLVLNASDKLAIGGLLNANGTTSGDGTTYNIAAVDNWLPGAASSTDIADTTGNAVTVSGVSAPTITSVTYDASTQTLVVTGANFVNEFGAANDIDVSSLTLTGESGGTYTLTSNDVEVSSSTQFSVTLNNTDALNINALLNADGTTSDSGTTYNLAAADNWMPGANANTDISDATGNGVTVSNVTVPAVTSATYDFSTGILVVTGTDFVSVSGGTNDVDVSTITIAGEGGSTYNLTSSDVEIDSATGFTVSLNAADTLAVNGLLNNNGTLADDGSTYNIGLADNWMAGAAASADISDATGNGITVSNVASPTITSATYDASSGVLAVTGTNFVNYPGASNDVAVTNLSLTGEGGNSYTLTSSSVEVTSSTAFSINLSAADVLNVNGLLNSNGTSSDDSTTYNLAAADNWMAGAAASVDIADATGNGITVSNVAVPTISSATYNASTGTLAITGTNFAKYPGATNDLDASLLSLTGEGSSSYTLTSSDVEISSATAASITLNATDQLFVNGLLNANGTTSDDGTTYNLAVADNWLAAAAASSDIADTGGNSVTVSGVSAPTITSATYDATNGVLVITGTNFVSVSGSNNDVDASTITLTGQGGSTYTISVNTSDVDVTSATQFTITLDSSDRDALSALFTSDGTSAVDSTTYNVAAADNWLVGAAASVNIADATNGVTASDTDNVPPTVSSVSASTANGSYKAGDVIAITVTFDETVYVTGTPQITLETGTTDRTVDYSSGSGTATLTFNYTVQAGDTSGDLAYASTTALALNGGTIADLATNDATLTLASPGNANSLSANKALVIDTTAPVVAEVSVTALTSDTTPDITFSNDEAGTLAVGGSCGSASEGAVNTGNITIALTDADNSSPLDDATYSNCTVTVTDAVGNSSNVLTLSSFAVDTTAPSVDTNAGLTLAEGASGTVSATELTVSDVNSDASNVVYTLSAVPSNGVLSNNGSELAVSDTFTQSDVAGDLITYAHDGSDTTSDSFSFAVADELNNSDNNGGSGYSFNFTVTAVNDTPTLTASGTSPAYTENDTNTALFSGAAAGTVESGQSFSEIGLTITGLSDGSNELLIVDGSEIALTNGNTGTTADSGLSYSVIEAAGTAVVAISGGTLSAAQLQTLVDSIGYRHSGEDPTAGARSITISSVTDSGGGADTATLNIVSTATVSAVNDVPDTVDDSDSVNEDDSVVIPVLDNDNDVDNAINPASVTVGTAPSNGSTSVNTTTGAITYTPDADFNGSDSFTYTVEDVSSGESAAATVSITINAVNDAPVAVADTGSTPEDNAVSIDVAANDTDIDTGDSVDPSTITIVTQPSDGSASVVSGEILYTPDLNFNGSDTLSYTIDDQNGATSNTVNVVINVTGVNDLPTATADSVSVDEDGSVAIDVLANDSDIDGTVDATTVQIMTYASNGSTSVDALTGEVTYTPDADFNGSDSFTYLVQDDSSGSSNVATVSITVNSVNDAPVAADDTASLLEDASHTVNVVGNDSDVDGTVTASTVEVVTAPSQGTAVAQGDGSIAYTPAANFNGTDTFTYRVQDNDGAWSSPATVTMTVNSVNDDPSAADDSATTDEDTAVTIDLWVNDSDLDGSLSSVTLGTASNGQVSDNGSGSVTYTPDADFFGSDSFTYTVTDDEGGVSTTATVTVTVQAVNDAPTISGSPALTVDEDSAYSFTPSASDIDPNTTLTYSVSNLPSWASFSTSTGAVTGTPLNDDVGEHPGIVVSVSDGSLTTDLPSFSITVNNTNDLPEIAGTPATSVNEDSGYSFTPTGSDVDVGDNLIYSVSNLPAWAVFDTGTGVISGTPDNSAVGSYNGIVVSVSDGIETVDLPSFDITVINTNDAPEPAADSYSLNEGGLLQPSAGEGVAANDVDIDGDNLTVSLVTGPRSATAFNLNADGSFSYQHNGGEVRSDSFTYTVTDGTVVSAPTTVALTVAPVNDPPSFVTQPPASSVVQGQRFRYAVGVSDSDSVANLTLVEAPSWLSLSSGQLTGVAPYDVEGETNIVLRASDDEYTVDQSFALNVLTREAPVVDILTSWVGLPSIAGEQLTLRVQLNHVRGPAVLSGVLGVDLQGTDFTSTLNACSAGDSVEYQCPASLAVGESLTYFLKLTPNARGNTVVVLNLDEQTTGNELGETITDVSTTQRAVSEGNLTFNLAKATALGSIQIIDDNDKEMVAGTSLGETVKLLDYDLETLIATQVGEIENRGETKAVKIGDIDLDSLHDIVVVNSNGDATQVYYQRGDLVFETEDATQPLALANEAMLRDLNNDDYPELLLGASGFDLYIYVNQNGVYSQVPYVFNSPVSIVHFALLGRKPSDGPLEGDLAIASSDAILLVRFALGVETGQEKAGEGSAPIQLQKFTLSELPIPGVTSIRTADLDGDGNEELVLSTEHENNSAEKSGVTIVSISGEGIMTEAAKLGNASAKNVEVADFNGDNIPDLMVANDNDSYQFYYGNGEADDFTLKDTIIYNESTLVLPEDVNDDGLSDVLIYENNEEEVEVFVSAPDGDVGAAADLLLSTSVAAANKAQYHVNYTLTVTNQGATMANDVLARFTVPETLTVAALPDTCTQTDDVVECAMGSLDAAANTSATILMAGDASIGALTLTAQVQSNGLEATPADNMAQSSLDGIFQPTRVKVRGGGGGGAVDPTWLLLLPALLVLSRRSRKGLAVFTLMLLSMFTKAEEPHWYTELSVGQATSNYSENTFEDKFAAVTQEGTVLNFDDSRTAWALLAGYQVSSSFSVEGGYQDWGEVELEVDAIASDVNAVRDFMRQEYPVSGEGAYLGTRWSHRDMQYVELFFKAGLLFWSADYTIEVGDIKEDLEQKGLDLVTAAGLSARLFNNTRGGIQLQHSRMDEQGNLQLSIFFSYGFK